MQDLNITLIQADQVWEDKKANLGHFEELLSRCEKTDLILFPEMFHTGFSMNARGLAEPVDNSPALKWLKDQASKYDCAVYTSFIVEEAGSFYNRGAFVLPSGEVTVYDKRKRFGMAGETEIYAAGNKEVIVEYRGWRISLQICYDLRFPENCRNGLDESGRAKYDLLLYVANWPEKRIAHWKALLPARAIENQCFVAGVNRIGTDANGFTYNGASAVLSPMGETVSNLRENTESIGRVSLKAGVISEIRKQLPFLRDSGAGFIKTHTDLEGTQF